MLGNHDYKVVICQEVYLASNPMRPGIGSSRPDFEPDRLKAIDMDGWMDDMLVDWMNGRYFLFCAAVLSVTLDYLADIWS